MYLRSKKKRNEVRDKNKVMSRDDPRSVWGEPCSCEGHPSNATNSPPFRVTAYNHCGTNVNFKILRIPGNYLNFLVLCVCACAYVCVQYIH